MIDIKVNTKEVLSFWDRLSSQYPFAVALALTQTAKQAAQEMPAEASKSLDKPTLFTLRGFAYTQAKKTNLSASVDVKPIQAEYMRYQVEGGIRRPKRKALKLPSEIELDQFGNIPLSVMRRLIQRAKQGKRLTRLQAKRTGISQQLDLFYGEPGDGRPAGLYKRVPLPGERNRLIPLVVFPEQPAKYEKRFNFYGAVQRVVQKRWADNMREAWKRAIASAK